MHKTSSSRSPASSSSSSSLLSSSSLKVAFALPLFFLGDRPLVTGEDDVSSISSSLPSCFSAFSSRAAAASLRAFLLLVGSLGPPFLSSSSLEDSSTSSSSSSSSSPSSSSVSGAARNNCCRCIASSSESKSDSSSSSGLVGAYTSLRVARAGVSPLVVLLMIRESALPLLSCKTVRDLKYVPRVLWSSAWVDGSHCNMKLSSDQPSL